MRYTSAMEPIQLIADYKYAFVIIHVLAVVTGMGAAIVTDILCLRFGFDKTLSRFEVSTIRFLSRVVTVALALILLTGAMTFLSNPEGYLASVKFLTKMTVVFVLVVNGYLLHRYIFKHIGDARILTSPNARALRKLGFALGAISIVSWVSALALGILLHIPVTYDTAIAIYAGVLVVAVLISQVLEWVLLERKK